MTAFWAAITATVAGLWWLWLFLGTFAVVMVLGLCRAAAREMPAPEPAPAMPPTLAAHIAQALAADVDAEWAAMQGEIGGAV